MTNKYPPNDSSRCESGFYLTKWFLDCIDEDGGTMIAYSAKMSWNGFSVPYTSVFLFQSGKVIINKSRLDQPVSPLKKGEIIEWHDKRYGVKGTWKQTSPTLKEKLYESQNGYLEWCCYQPEANTEVHIKGKGIIKGKGYAEQLTLTIEPWKIHMEQLRWGRFHSGEDSLVWVEFKGEKLKRWVWYNGKKVEATHLDDDHLFILKLGIQLKLENKQVLEQGKKIYNIAKSLLSYLPGFNKVIPGFFLNAKEIKWMSRGTLEQDGASIRQGWAIHELVDFV
ncbi:hypothetical protein E9993_15970 [Labilibacter sediminis]|nr:hypothetical protein E9993_15970 [Labilibacter sediminis]